MTFSSLLKAINSTKNKSETLMYFFVLLFCFETFVLTTDDVFDGTDDVEIAYHEKFPSFEWHIKNTRGLIDWSIDGLSVMIDDFFF